MPDHKDPTYRSFTEPDGDAIEYRQPEDEDGVFDVRLPIATTGEVRNEGDEPLSRDELSGMARQIEERSIGVFLDHGGSSLGGRERYSAVEKLGEWRDGGVQTREADDTDELVATARMMDPETLPNGVKSIREAVGAIKEQVQRGFSVSASIGWREDEDYPGGNDLMEASIVGIGADPRTTSEASPAVVARAAVEAGADPDELVERVREAVDDESGDEEYLGNGPGGFRENPDAEELIKRENPDAERPFGPPSGPDDLWDGFDDCVSDVEGWEGVDDPEAFCAWAENQSESDTQDDDMSDQESPPDEGEDTTKDEQDSEEPDETQDTMGAEEFREEMLAMQESQLELLETLAEDEDDDEDEDDEEDMEMDEDEDDDEDEEQELDEQDADDDNMAERLTQLESELEQFRDGEIEAELPDEDEEEQRDTSETKDDLAKHGIHN